jgi:hypothetical protein
VRYLLAGEYTSNSIQRKTSSKEFREFSSHVQIACMSALLRLSWAVLGLACVGFKAALHPDRFKNTKIHIHIKTWKWSWTWLMIMWMMVHADKLGAKRCLVRAW